MARTTPEPEALEAARETDGPRFFYVRKPRDLTVRWWSRLPRGMLAIGRRQAFTLLGASVATRLAQAADNEEALPPSLALDAPGEPSVLTPPQPLSPAPRRWPSYFGRKTVWGYVNRHSVTQGERFELMLSTGPGQGAVRGRVEFFRLAGGPQREQTPVWVSAPVGVPAQPTNVAAAALGPNWVPILGSIDTTGWPPGYYSADFAGDNFGQRDSHIAQIIVRPLRPRGDILVKLGTNTYQAYNDWGGYSFYTGGRDEMVRGPMISFDRPSPPGFLEYELYLARWLEDMAEKEGFRVDYASNFDVHADPALLPAYRLVICGSHDQYWSKEEFDAFERRIFRHGSNTVFMGGNTAYWQVRFADIDRPPGGADYGRQLICYKSIRDPIARRPSPVDPALLVTAQFREGSRRPESMLVGVAFQSWFTAGSGGSQRVPYYVATTASPLFEGTGYAEGDRAADVVGYEWDNRDPYGNGARLWDKDRSRIALLPADKIQVLFRGSPVDIWGRRGVAEAIYYESPAGAKVFSAGSVRWAWGLGRQGYIQPAFQIFNANLIRHMLA